MTAVTRVLVQADQLQSQVGGGRFLRGLLGQFDAPTSQRHWASGRELSLTLLCTQGEHAQDALGTGVRIGAVSRRFPSRTRGTLVERAWSCLLPPADVIYGPFFHVFPHPRAGRVVTIHDTTFLYPEFHGSQRANRLYQSVAETVDLADIVVCISRTTEMSVLETWPQCIGKTRVIYNGVTIPAAMAPIHSGCPRGSLLVVGTVEPRKNYQTILRAYEVLRQRRPQDFPRLKVVGRRGWMSDTTEQELRRLHESGLCEWLDSAGDLELWHAYSECRVFTYLPLMEGFGYPPFEAAAVGCPLVLSDRSSVGEIWSESARCVDPTDIDAIVTAWEWALDLGESDRLEVAAQQRRTLERYSWATCYQGYAKAWAEAADART
jgi:glycosyltransferase involved in cell wall biosynthesis